MKQSMLALADGSVYYGKPLGHEGTSAGELVFNTAMTGYQEALTDPSYAGQVLISTYPLIGNYGVSRQDFESKHIHVRGYVVREACNRPIHRHSIKSLNSFLQEHGIPGIEGIDTRSIVRKLRNVGVMPCALSTEIDDVSELLKLARSFDYDKEQFMEKVVEKDKITFAVKGNKKKVVMLDCGVKLSIVRDLNARGVDVISLPYNADAQNILSQEPDGIVVTNGPGNPALLGKTIGTVRSLYTKFPMLAICLGIQLLGHAIGGNTYKLKFGHRSANQPVLDLDTGRVIITTQNHGFAVDEKSLPTGWRVSQRNANDGSVEGIAHRDLPIISVQYHPEANPGPYDGKYLFDDFVRLL